MDEIHRISFGLVQIQKYYWIFSGRGVLGENPADFMMKSTGFHEIQYRNTLDI